MRWDLNIFSLMFVFLPPVENINLKLEGLIDFGPKWNFEYSLIPVRDHYVSTLPSAGLRHKLDNNYYSKLQLLSRTPSSKIPTTLSSKVEPTSTVKVKTILPTSEHAKTASEIQDTWPMTTEESKPARYTQYIFEDTHKKKKRVRFTRIMPAEEPGNENIEDNPVITETIDIPDPLKYDKEVKKTNETMKPIDRQQIQLITKPSISPTNKSTMPPTLAALKGTTKNYKWMTNNSEIYSKLHKVEDDDRIKEFTLHVMRQNLQVFENIKSKIDDEKTKRKLDLLSKYYMRKIADFVQETRHQDVKTRLGTQKVILNTIDTSNNILHRLVNYFIGNINQHPSLRNLGIENIIKTEVDKEIDLEYKHACKKFGICRTTDGFQKFFVDIITDLLKNNNTQLRIATDSLAEAIKNTDFGKVVDWDLQKKVDDFVWEIETIQTDLIKPMYTMWRNAIALRNKPITVMRGVEGGSVNKTVAFIDLMDILDSKIQASEANNKLWQKIKSDVSQWTQDPTTMDIQKVVVEIIKHIEYEIDQFDVDTAQDINDKLTIMLSEREQPEGPSTVGLT